MMGLSANCGSTMRLHSQSEPVVLGSQHGGFKVEPPLTLIFAPPLMTVPNDTRSPFRYLRRIGAVHGLPTERSVAEGALMRRIHGLPGTTYSNPTERGKYRSEARATMTMAEPSRRTYKMASPCERPR
jgi:hypothetical protein